MTIPHYKPQHVIALAMVNQRRAHHALPPITWETLECGARDRLEAALLEATYILEALDAAGLHVTEKGND